MGKLLVIRGGAIGDFILTLPALAALRRQFAKSRIELLGYPHIAQLAKAGGLVDEVRSIEARALAGFFSANAPLDPALAGYFSGFHLVLSYLYDPDLVFQFNVGRCSKAQFIAGPHRPDEADSVHAAAVFLKPLERLAIFEADGTPRLELNPTEPGASMFARLEPAASLEGGTVDSESKWLAIHPGSGSEKKNWPEAKWAELLRQLTAETSLSFLLIGGEAEGERLQRLALLLPARRMKLALSRPLVELAHALRQCQAYLGHDSGISHLAAAVGLRGLILWGESNPQIWRPRSDRFEILRAPGGLSELAVTQVWAELSRSGPGSSPLT